MRVSQWIAVGCLTILCVLSTRVGAKPFKTSRTSQTNDRRRTRTGMRRMRLLQRILQTIPPQEKQLLLSPNVSKREQDSKPQVELMPVVINSINQPLSEIECPKAEDGIKLFACPTPDAFGVYRCLDDHALCDNKLHCPNGEDENPTVCMFHRMTMNYFKVLTDTLFDMRETVL